MTHKQTRREFLANAARAATGVLVSCVVGPEPVEAEVFPSAQQVIDYVGVVRLCQIYNCLPSQLVDLLKGPPAHLWRFGCMSQLSRED